MPTEGQGKKLYKLKNEIRSFSLYYSHPIIQQMKRYYSHPIIQQMKRKAERWFEESGIAHFDIDDWHSK